MNEPETYFTLFPTPLGDCGIAWRGDKVVATHLPERTTAETASRLKARATATEGEPSPITQRAIASITTLLEGARTDLTHIACEFSNTDDFSLKVYAATRAIPPGKTLTYGEIAVELGNKRFAQNVGRVMGLNPLPIIVPCHRVVGANGKLTGFSAHGGVETKLRMLSIEGAQLGEAPGLFDDMPLDFKP